MRLSGVPPPRAITVERWVRAEARAVDSRRRKRASPWRAKISGMVAPARCSRWVSRSRKVQPTRCGEEASDGGFACSHEAGEDQALEVGGDGGVGGLRLDRGLGGDHLLSPIYCFAFPVVANSVRQRKTATFWVAARWVGFSLFLESHRPASRWRIPVAKVGGGLEVLFHPVGKCSWGALELQEEFIDGGGQFDLRGEKYAADAELIGSIAERAVRLSGLGVVGGIVMRSLHGVGGAKCFLGRD